MHIIADVIILGFLLICAYNEWKHAAIPLLTMLFFAASSIALTIAFGEEDVGLILSGGILGIMLLVINKCVGGIIGYKNCWIITFLGIYLGLVRVIWLLSVTLLSVGMFRLVFLKKNTQGKGEPIPIAPFLAIAYLGTVFI